MWRVTQQCWFSPGSCFITASCQCWACSHSAPLCSGYWQQLDTHGKGFVPLSGANPSKYGALQTSLSRLSLRAKLNILKRFKFRRDTTRQEYWSSTRFPRISHQQPVTLIFVLYITTTTRKKPQRDMKPDLLSSVGVCVCLLGNE